MDQDREIIREELHQLVWSKPTRIAAKEFDLSDVGLPKICRKLGVKKPPRGYWAKVTSGLRVAKPRLGALPDGCVSKAVIRANTETEQMAKPIPRNEVPGISIRENLQGCSRLITATRVELGNETPDKYGVLDVRQKPGRLGAKCSLIRLCRTFCVEGFALDCYQSLTLRLLPGGATLPG